MYSGYKETYEACGHKEDTMLRLYLDPEGIAVPDQKVDAIVDEFIDHIDSHILCVANELVITALRARMAEGKVEASNVAVHMYGGIYTFTETGDWIDQPPNEFGKQELDYLFTILNSKKPFQKPSIFREE